MVAERIQKVLAAAGVASRRGAEALVASGRVTVDGRPARIGEQVDPAVVRIEVDGRPIPTAPHPRLYLAVHKPAGVTSTVRDRHAERTVLELVPAAVAARAGRLYPVGRLDRDSEGLILLTNDGDWAHRVLHPARGVEREYAVGLRAPLRPEQVAALEAGIELEEGLGRVVHLRPASAVEVGRLAELLEPRPGPLAWYRVTLVQGWKRQLRRMFGAVGAPIERLVRVRVGTVRLDGLRSGESRLLPAGLAAAIAPAVAPAVAPAPGPARGPGRPARRAQPAGRR